MLTCYPLRSMRAGVIILTCLSLVPIGLAQGARQSAPNAPIPDSDSDHVTERNEWFFRGRLVPGKPSAELRRRAYQAKLQMRAQRAAALAAARSEALASVSSVPWAPLGPVPLASDATGNGTQDYHQVSVRTFPGPLSKVYTLNSSIYASPFSAVTAS